jgi:hypothetical protein
LASTALRLGSPGRLLEDLRSYLALIEPELAIDYRDVLVGLAPFHDCAARLGVDPVALFDEASVGRAEAARQVVTAFARRSDVTLENFGWMLSETPNGPCYQPAERASWQRGSRPLSPR